MQPELRQALAADEAEVRDREVALGGPDTATRAKIVWQVRVFEPKDLNPPLNPPLKPADVTCAGFEETDLWKNLMKTLQPPDRSEPFQPQRKLVVCP